MTASASGSRTGFTAVSARRSVAASRDHSPRGGEPKRASSGRDAPPSGPISERADEVGVREVVGTPVRRCGAEHEAHPGADAGRGPGPRPARGGGPNARHRPARRSAARRFAVPSRSERRSGPTRAGVIGPIGLEARDELADAPGRGLELGPGVALAPMTRGRRLDAPVRDAELRHPPGCPFRRLVLAVMCAIASLRAAWIEGVRLSPSMRSMIAAMATSERVGTARRGRRGADGRRAASRSGHGWPRAPLIGSTERAW